MSSTRRRAAGPGRAPVSLYRTAGPAGKPGSKPRRAAEISLTMPGLDLATRLRVFQRALRSHVERRGALLDIVRAVNTTLEPAKIAELVVERAATWVPTPCWALVAADDAAPLSVLADRGLEPDMGPAVLAIAGWVMARGEEFVSADLRRDSRVADQSAACVIAFPLSCRGRRVGALIGLDRVPSSREPRLAPAIQRAVRVLLEPASVALDNALQLKRAEALSVTDDLTRLYNTRYLNSVLRRETKRASRSGRPLSLLFLDLDGFKTINDRYGHLFGSRALVEAAAVIRGSARETDVVARFGGDDLTRLYNTRYLNSVLRRETKRASRSGRPLSLLFLDLDGFKNINDRYGHLFGSRALVEAAAVIRGSARETDVVARFGGDEFALILPDTGSEGAFAVGERIRERIAAHEFLAGYGFTVHLTASVGVATLPDAAASADELVQSADKAMYQVKGCGKNGIQIAALPADS